MFKETTANIVWVKCEIKFIGRLFQNLLTNLKKRCNLEHIKIGKVSN
jgi:hypothetical protein